MNKNRNTDAEMELASLSPQAGNSLNMTPPQPQQPDPIMDNIRIINTHTSITIANILYQMRNNEEQLSISFARRQEFESIQNDPEQLRHFHQQVPGFGPLLQHNISIVESVLQRNIRTLQSLMEQFEQAVTYNLTLLTGSKEQLVSQKIATWKHEQQRLANGINIPRSVSLHQLQLWCSELVNCTWELYKQLQDAGEILQHRTTPTGNHSNHNAFLQDRSQQVLKLLQELLNNSLVVEEQPQQIINLNAKLTKSIVISLLTGKCLNIQMAPPMITTSIITEEQARSLSLSPSNGVENMMEITNGSLGMEYKEDTQRLSVTFTNLQLRRVLGKNEEQRKANNKRVMENKVCLHFACAVTVGTLQIKLSTTSLPIVMTSHGSQETLAAGRIWYDHGFGAMGRLPFEVPDAAPWSEVAEILSAKFEQVTGRGLTQHNLDYLAKLAFRNQQPQPATITFDQLCKDPLPGVTFTFFAWFHGALKLVEKSGTQLKELWKEELIMGFTDRQYAEQLLCTYKNPGTFLIRFASRHEFGALSIVCRVGTDPPQSMHPFQSLDLQAHKLPLRIKEIENIEHLVKQTFKCVHKHNAFGPFYNKENSKAQVSPGPNKPPYVKILHAIPAPNIAADATVPVAPPQGISHRSSLPEALKVPGAGQQTCGPYEHHPLQLSYSSPSPRTTQPFQNPENVQTVGGPSGLPQSMPMSTSLETDSNIGVAYGHSHIMPNIPHSPLPNFSHEFGTPPPLLPLSESPGSNMASYDYESIFDDLIRVIHTDDMDMGGEGEDLTDL